MSNSDHERTLIEIPDHAVTGISLTQSVLILLATERLGDDASALLKKQAERVCADVEQAVEIQAEAMAEAVEFAEGGDANS